MTPAQVQGLIHDGLRLRMYEQQNLGAVPTIISVTEVGGERLAVVFGDATIATVKITVHPVTP